MIENLIEAIKAGDNSRVQQLLQANPQLIRSKDVPLSPILLSIYMGKNEITTLLLETGIELTLHEASACGDLNRIRSILDQHPERINEYGSDGFTPLGFAAYFGHIELVKIMIERGADVNFHSKNAQNVAPLHSAVSAKHTEIIDLLIKNGADINAKQENNVTPLMQAAHHGDIEMVRKFLELGANKSAVTSDGKTALTYAEESQSEEVISLLRQA